MRFSFINSLLIIVNIIFIVIQFILMKMDDFFLNLDLLKLIVPFFCFINLLFFIFWVYKLKWPLFIFIFSLVFTFDDWKLLYQFPNNAIVSSKGLKIMSFNVRNFNVYKWIKKRDIPKSIQNFIRKQNPEIICFQEFDKELAPDFNDYPFQYFNSFGSNINRGSCILSKIPIFNTGIINFKNSNNGGIYLDVKKGRDTLKIFNIHFESLGLSTEDTLLIDKTSFKLIKKIQNIFNKQKDQVYTINNFLKQSKYPIIICSDLNNNPFSIAYKKLSNGKKDAFIEAGSGFGNSYFFGFFPIRIDYILVDQRLKVLSFSTFKDKLSDHRAIMAKLDYN